jgi:peptidoglycan/LPS O-acetylase OafA/YrhL
MTPGYPHDGAKVPWHGCTTFSSIRSAVASRSRHRSPTIPRRPLAPPAAHEPNAVASVRAGAPARDPLRHVERRLPRLTGIDGLRAIAVAAVLVFHAGLALPGGFLGVEVFFVISGYLITGLLLVEWTATRRIALRRFWFRRARRLLPALFALLLVSLAFAVVVLPDEVTRLRSDAAAAAAYVSNWYLILGEQSYFETAERQSPLLHLWSLAVEEQFYVVWPVVLAVGLAVLRRRGMFLLTLVAAAGSAVWMATVFDPATDPSRVYYGTDTRLTGLLLGAALAFVWVPGTRPASAGSPAAGAPAAAADEPGAAHDPAAPAEPVAANRTRRRWAGPLADAAVLAGALVLGWAFLALDGGSELLYRGGFVAVGLATLAMIAGAVHPASRIGGRVLEIAPFRWLGTRSYSVYLWHWPIFAVTRPELDVPIDGPALLALRLVATGLLAELSYRLVEQPIRRGALGRAWQRWREEAWRSAPGTRSPARTRLATLASVGILSISGLLATVATASPPERPSWLPVDDVSGVIDGDPTPAPTLRPRPAAPSEAPVASATPSLAPTPTPDPRPSVLAVGDSMLVATAGALADSLGRVEVDASVGRQVDEGIEIIEARRKAGTLPDVVVLNLGVNGPLYVAQFERAMEVLRDVDLVVWVTVTVPRPWEATTNKVLRQQVPRYGNAILVDWHANSAGREDLFWRDGYHPRAEGAHLYAELITTAIRGAVASR